MDLDAVWVSFLLADMSGRALVRLVHVPIGDVPGGRRHDEDVAMVLPFDGGPQEQALRAQHVLVHSIGELHVVRAPVTQRGEAIGLLEITLPVAPTDAVVQRVSRAAHTLAFVVIANRRHTDLFECPTMPACWSSTGTAGTAQPAVPQPARTLSGPAHPTARPAESRPTTATWASQFCPRSIQQSAAPSL